MTLQMTGIYASLLAILGIYLSIMVSAMRGKTGIAILHGENMVLAERMRRHGNFIESVPLVLILMGAVELGGASPNWLHAIGGILLVSRIIHPFGIDHQKPDAPARIIGTVGTQIATLIAVVFLVWSALG
ncbi:MAG: MAPEG family protein [Rhizobiaceae bacterium]|nr:MAPEG family protein [Rhizobiaceae bacterium]